MHLSQHAGLQAPPSISTYTKAACNIQRHCCPALGGELFGQVLSGVVQFGENPLRERREAFSGERAARSWPRPQARTHLGDLGGSEVDDLPELFSVEDGLDSLLQKEREVFDWTDLNSSNQFDGGGGGGVVLWLQCEVCGAPRSWGPW